MHSPSPRSVPRLWGTLAPFLALTLLFAWVYGRVIPDLHFAMDDYVNAGREWSVNFGNVVVQAFNGGIRWSGYRPLAIVMRGGMNWLFGLTHMAGYYVVYLGLHLANTLLAYALLRRAGAGAWWAWLAAAIFLLLPSHNEAVLWFAANSNPLAMFWALLALTFALESTRTARRWAQAAAVAAFVLGMLSFEVVIALPALIFAADWALHRGKVRARTLMYAGFAVAALAILGVHLWIGQGHLAPERADYGFTADPARIARGYWLLGGQMVLLHTSPWPDWPLYQNVRAWMAWSDPVALAAMALAVLGSAGVVAAAGSGGSEQAGFRRVHPLAWAGWGLLWVAAIGLPFAGLAGRNPENRYTYMLAFGFGVAVSALLAWAGAARHSSRRAMLRRVPAVLLGTALVAFYAYVSTSDAAEWARAGRIMADFERQLLEQIPALGPEETIVQLGVPGHVGAAYLYTIQPAFANAVSLRYGPRPVFATMDDLGLRRVLTADRDNAPNVHVVFYNPGLGTLHRVDTVLFCKATDSCRSYDVNEGGDSPVTALSYVQLYNPETPEVGGAMLVADVDPWEVHGCWPFHDPQAGTPAADTYERLPLSALCAQAAQILLEESK